MTTRKESAFLICCSRHDRRDWTSHGSFLFWQDAVESKCQWRDQTSVTFRIRLMTISPTWQDFRTRHDANNCLGSITSRCSGKQAALLPRQTGVQSVGNRAYWLTNSIISTDTWMKCDSTIIIHGTPGHKSKHGTFQSTRLTNKERQDKNEDQPNNGYRHGPHDRIQTILLTGLFASSGAVWCRRCHN